MDCRFLFLCIVACFLFCELPENPCNINNAGIVNETLTALPETVPVNSVYQCTLTVRYPEFIDSFSVFASKSAGSPFRMAGASVGDDTTLVFQVHLQEAATWDLSLYLYRGPFVDTVSGTVSVFSTTPSVNAVASETAVFIGNDAEVSFEASDPDSNLFKYTVLVGEGGTPDTQQFLAGERAQAQISRQISASGLRSFRDTSVLFFVSVIDEDGQAGASAVCTLTIRDTAAPSITLLPPLFHDSVHTVASLPETLYAKVNDSWAVDSVKFAESRLSFAGGDTVAIMINSLDSGTTVDTLKAWDPAGNCSSVSISLFYDGPKVYPPSLTPFYQTATEGEAFDTVFLDSKVTITDPDADYGKDSLLWSVKIDTVDSGMAVGFDSVARILTVTGPSGELFHDRMAVLSVTVTDPAGQSASLNGVTFIMVEKNDPPRITLKGQGKIFGNPFDTLKLDTCGHDPEGNASLFWVIERGRYFYPESTYVDRCANTKITDLPRICYKVFSGKVLILADADSIATLPVAAGVVDTLKFRLKSIDAADTMETSRDVVFTWGRLKIIDPIEIPELHKIE